MLTSASTAPTGQQLRLPVADGWNTIELWEPRAWTEHPGPYQQRVAFAAAHVVADPRGDNVPGAPAVVDWDSTLAIRRQLIRYGLGIAEAMDTAQRNMGLDWPAVQELISRSAGQAQLMGARIASGAGTDHRGDVRTLREVIDAYSEQVEFVESTGSQVILMASRQLTQVAETAEDYLRVYDALLAQVREPVILHWLGDIFDPALRGYWGSTDVTLATETFLAVVREHSAKIDGVKVSLLEAAHEIGLRPRLPAAVRLYTGDDFHYPELIRGDGTHHSDALLGAFAAIAPAAAAALSALDVDDVECYHAEMAATLDLSRHLFTEPTRYYKTGIAFLAWLNGHQPGFTMVGGLQSARSVLHLSSLFALANDARLLPDPELSARRMTVLLDVAGVSA